VTTLSLTAAPAASVVAQLSECVEDIAAIVGDGCLVESASGRLVAHALHPDGTTPEVVAALVAGELSALHEELTARRTTGLLASGSVVEGVLDQSGRRIAHLALRDSGLHVGGIWLLPRAVGVLPLESLRLPIQRLIELLGCPTPGGGEPSLAACLEGDPVPDDLAGAKQVWVARLAADLPSERLARSAARARCALSIRAASSSRGAYLVLTSPRLLSDTKVTCAVQSVVDQVAEELALPVTAGLSAAVCPTTLVLARRQADAALLEARTGSCASIADVRSRAMLRSLAPAVRDLPDLGADPLDALRDYDRRRGCDLSSTLLAWLDAFGDVARMTSELAVHPNTLRYRLRRIQEITGVDLRSDSAGRLELHLRLHTEEMP
jgi:hypothetical protein